MNTKMAEHSKVQQRLDGKNSVVQFASIALFYRDTVVRLLVEIQN